jgi:monoamine oxidase
LVIEGMNPENYRIALGPAVKHFARVASRFWTPERLGPDGMSEQAGETWDATDLAADGPFGWSLFAGGPAAQRGRAARTPKDPHGDAFYDVALKRMYGAYRAEKTGFMSWPDEAWIRCGYSCLAPGEMANAKRLTEPFENRIIFAGEHACPAFYGYMEGALESGLLAADCILESMGWFERNAKPHNAIRDALERATRAGTQLPPN